MDGFNSQISLSTSVPMFMNNVFYSSVSLLCLFQLLLKYEDNASLLKSVGKFTSFSIFWKPWYKINVIFFLRCLVDFTNETFRNWNFCF